MRRWADILRDWPADVPTGFNLAPTQIAPVFAVGQSNEAGRTYAMKWGLIPSWSKQATSKYATFNARVESVAEKPAFRQPWAKKQHCLVPALGYYEWKKSAAGKQPYFIRSAQQDEILVMAGLWEQRREELSFTILTEAAQAQMAELHDRVPVLLSREAAEQWLDGCQNFPRQSDTRVPLRYFAVDTEVNNARNQGAQLIKPLQDEEQ